MIEAQLLGTWVVLTLAFSYIVRVLMIYVVKEKQAKDVLNMIAGTYVLSSMVFLVSLLLWWIWF